MRVLIIGDVVGRPGRRALTELLPGLVSETGANFVIVNGENAAGGAGITRETAAPLYAAGAHVLTMGNHVWGQRDGYSFLQEETRVVRPGNFPAGAPGRGAYVYETAEGVHVGVINLQGRTFMQAIDDPFRAGDALIAGITGEADCIFVDFHAEATSEKKAFAWHVDGRVTCVFGTHTHVPTADEQVLPKGTAFITDVGMTGPSQSIIGMRPDEIIERFITGLPARFEVAKGAAVMEGAVVDVDVCTGHARAIERVRREIR